MQCSYTRHDEALAHGSLSGQVRKLPWKSSATKRSVPAAPGSSCHAARTSGSRFVSRGNLAHCSKYAMHFAGKISYATRRFYLMLEKSAIYHDFADLLPFCGRCVLEAPMD